MAPMRPGGPRPPQGPPVVAWIQLSKSNEPPDPHGLQRSGDARPGTGLRSRANPSKNTRHRTRYVRSSSQSSWKGLAARSRFWIMGSCCSWSTKVSVSSAEHSLTSAVYILGAREHLLSVRKHSLRLREHNRALVEHSEREAGIPLELGSLPLRGRDAPLREAEASGRLRSSSEVLRNARGRLRNVR